MLSHMEYLFFNQAKLLYNQGSDAGVCWIILSLLCTLFAVLRAGRSESLLAEQFRECLKHIRIKRHFALLKSSKLPLQFSVTNKNRQMKNMIITTKVIPFWKKGCPLHVHALALICRSPAVCFGASTHCFALLPQVWVFWYNKNHQIYLLYLEHADSEIQKNDPESCQKIFFFYFWKALPWQISSLCTKDNQGILFKTYDLISGFNGS